MKNVVSVVHGWEIHLSPFSNTYWVYDEETNTSKEWKTLRGAVRWCERH